MPEQYQLYLFAAQSMWVLFVFAIGACVGSLINVLVYRLPLGMSVVTPPSRCPACDTRLTWRENIPIFGWLFLRGRCRFCKSRISPEYPLVELFVALLFAGFFVLYYTVPPSAHALGMNLGAISPEWARSDAFDAWPRHTWPIFVVVLVLLGSLVAMTIVDAKTFTIPLEIPWFATATALLFHVGHAAYLSWSGHHALPRSAPNTPWAIPLPGWNATGPFVNSATASWWLGASLFAALGLILSNLALKLRLFPRSFADYNDWEQQALQQLKAADAVPAAASKLPQGGAVEAGFAAETEGAPAFSPASPPSPPLSSSPSTSDIPHPTSDIASTSPKGEVPPQAGVGAPDSPLASPSSSPPSASNSDIPHPTSHIPRASLLSLSLLILLAAAGNTAGPALGIPRWSGFLLGLLALPIVYALTLRTLERRTPAPPAPAIPAESPSDMWIQYPHARREMLKEILFLTPPVALALLGGWLFKLWLANAPAPPALWIMVLGGVLQGYLIAGAIVWAVRILGSLGFNKEAMGLGDVHLLAAVGACIGWVDAALAFPLAAVVGLYWVIVSMIRTGGAPRAMPFGPYLAGATLLVMLGKPLIELGLTWLMAIPPGQRGINLP